MQKNKNAYGKDSNNSNTSLSYYIRQFSKEKYIKWHSSQLFHLYPAYKIFLPNDMILNYDPWPWKTIGFFLSSRSSNVRSCTILQLTIWSLTWQQSSNTKWCYDIDLWPWQAMNFFISFRWSSVPSCIILNLTICSLSFLQGFNSKRCYDFDLDRHR
jgi:hypothetical protein